MTDEIIIFGVILMCILFAGDPDLMDAIISLIECNK